MMEFFSTWYGMALAGLIVLIALFSTSKIAGFLGRLIFIGLVIAGAFLYFRHLIY